MDSLQWRLSGVDGEGKAVEVFEGAWIGLSFFQERSQLEKNFRSLYEGGGSPTAPQYSKFLKDFNWMHIVSQLANNEFLRMEEVLNQTVIDVYAYLQYMDAKVSAENAQMKFVHEMDKRKK